VVHAIISNLDRYTFFSEKLFFIFIVNLIINGVMINCAVNLS